MKKNWNVQVVRDMKIGVKVVIPIKKEDNKNERC